MGPRAPTKVPYGPMILQKRYPSDFRRGSHLTPEEVALATSSGVRWLPLLEYYRAIMDLCRGPRAHRVALIGL